MSDNAAMVWFMGICIGFVMLLITALAYFLHVERLKGQELAKTCIEQRMEWIDYTCRTPQQR